MNRINQRFIVASLSASLLLQVACSKQETAAPAAVAKSTEMAAATPKPMDMPMAKDVPGSMDKNAVHHVDAVVKSVDAANGIVTLSHGPVATLNWPPMTMGFKVKDKALMDKLATDKKVAVDFVQDGSDYVITVVK